MSKIHRALVVCRSNAYCDPRPSRMIDFLESSGYEVDLLHNITKSHIGENLQYEIHPRANTKTEKIRNKIFETISLLIVKVMPFILDSLFEKYFFRYSTRSLDYYRSNYKVVVVESLEFLPFIIETKSSKSRIIFDAREYYPKQHEGEWFFDFFWSHVRHHFCKKYLLKCDHVITVSDGLANAYQENYSVSASVILSTPRYIDQYKPKHHLSKGIRLVHHGKANRNRSLEKMIQIVATLGSGFSLDLYLTGSKGYIRELDKLTKGISNVKIIPPVPYEDIIHMLSEYDIGMYYLEPVGFNVTYNLPNKFFEFIQARLPVAIGPSPDMSKIVNQYNIGFVSEFFTVESMIKTLQSINVDVYDLCKYNCELAALELSYEVQEKKLSRIIL
jgi:glycosyltransferase involved in cell wall biosynthesis